MLLAPAGAKSLSAIGGLYKLDKFELTQYEYNNMDILIELDREKFIRYAIRDSVIALEHANWMADFNFDLGGLGVPMTLSSIGTKFSA